MYSSECCHYGIGKVYNLSWAMSILFSALKLYCNLIYLVIFLLDLEGNHINLTNSFKKNFQVRGTVIFADTVHVY